MKILRSIIAWSASIYLGLYIYAYLIAKLISTAYEIWLSVGLYSSIVFSIWFIVYSAFIKNNKAIPVFKKSWQFALCTGLIGSIFPTIFTYMAVYKFLDIEQNLNSLLLMTTSGFIAGTLLGYVYWILMYLKAPNKALKRDAGKAPRPLA